MWVHQRIGRNTAISTPLWLWVLGVLVIAGIIVNVWWAFAVIAVVATVRYLRGTSGPDTSGKTVSRDVVAGEYRRLVALERRDRGLPRLWNTNTLPVNLEDMARLQQKYYRD